jgi:alpha-beta hydrolase superfamily lysophospholipase
MSKLLVASALFFMCGCTTWFFQPTKVDYTAGWEQRSTYLKQNAFFLSQSGNQLNYWVFPSKKNAPPKAIVLQFHGNAQNISSHFASLGWVVDFGYEFMTFDYSGYGSSEGKANIKNALLDIKSAIEFARTEAKNKKVPLILYSQSLGGALLLKALRDEQKVENICALFVESSFYSLPKIAQSIASRVWLLWPIQWVPLLTISNKYNPTGEGIESLNSIPKFILHAKKDPVIPYQHGKKLFEKLEGTKEFWEYEVGHISFWLRKENQEKLIRTLDLNSKKCNLKEI